MQTLCSVRGAEVEIIWLEIAATRQAVGIKDRYGLPVIEAKASLAQLAQHAVHMDARQPADFSKVALPDAKLMMGTIGQRHCVEACMGFADEMSEPPDSIQPAKPEGPRTVHRCVEHGAKPELFCESQTVGKDQIQMIVRHCNDPSRRQCSNRMVQDLKGVAVKINKFSRQMERNKLAKAFPVGHISTKHPLNQKGAAGERPARLDDGLTGGYDALIIKPCHQRTAFICREATNGPAGQEPVECRHCQAWINRGTHRLSHDLETRDGCCRSTSRRDQTLPWRFSWSHDVRNCRRAPRVHAACWNGGHG